ncbi:hypothetical protein M514_06269 [Trichuris suis]|uniref:Uncharacterized protein n=1 Tax=Trichuris suis TaxID=68888 RepID=A0A085M6D2_9BILA|nr:hypothetical protein M513_06269 [Trichuris suis]KFD71937.1 hypothetical protein M514_06269 [Trichuris suis]
MRRQEKDKDASCRQHQATGLRHCSPEAVIPNGGPGRMKGAERGKAPKEVPEEWEPQIGMGDTFSAGSSSRRRTTSKRCGRPGKTGPAEGSPGLEKAGKHRSKATMNLFERRVKRGNLYEHY